MVFIFEDIINLKNGVNIYIWYVGYCVMKIFFFKFKDVEMVDIKVIKFVDIFFLFLVGICVFLDNCFFVFVIDILVFKFDSFIKD